MIARFEDIEKELWYRMRNSGEIVLRDGQKLKDISDSHLINLYNYLARNKDCAHKIDASIFDTV